jgi:hypothetical protein
MGSKLPSGENVATATRYQQPVHQKYDEDVREQLAGDDDFRALERIDPRTARAEA